MSLTTPVEVSDWVTNTACGLAGSAAMAASRRWGSTFSPYSNSTCVVAAPYASHISAQRSPNLPHEAATAVSGPDQVGDRLHRPGPRGGEAEHRVAGLEDPGQALEAARVDLDEGGGAVVEDRLGHHL